MLASHQLICTENLIRSQGLWVPLSRPAQNLQCSISWILCARISTLELYIGLLQVFTTSLSSYTKNISCLPLFFQGRALMWHCPSTHSVFSRFWSSMLEFLPDGNHQRYCSFKAETWTLKLPFSFFFCSRWKMTFLLAILMLSCCLDIFWRNLSSPRSQCHLSVSSMNSEIPLLKVKEVQSCAGFTKLMRGKTFGFKHSYKK